MIHVAFVKQLVQPAKITLFVHNVIQAIIFHLRTVLSVPMDAKHAHQ